jgi:hypothetical protein
MKPGAPAGEPGWPRGWAEHRRRQLLAGLRLTPAERLRWLEETLAALRRWQGLARGGAPTSPRDTYLR